MRHLLALLVLVTCLPGLATAAPSFFQPVASARLARADERQQALDAFYKAVNDCSDAALQSFVQTHCQPTTYDKAHKPIPFGPKKAGADVQLVILLSGETAYSPGSQPAEVTASADEAGDWWMGSKTLAIFAPFQCSEPFRGIIVAQLARTAMVSCLEKMPAEDKDVQALLIYRTMAFSRDQLVKRFAAYGALLEREVDHLEEGRKGAGLTPGTYTFPPPPPPYNAAILDPVFGGPPLTEKEKELRVNQVLLHIILRHCEKFMPADTKDAEAWKLKSIRSLFGP